MSPATVVLLVALGAAPAGSAAAFGDSPVEPGPDAAFLVCLAVREQQALEYRWRQFEYLKDETQEKLDEARVTARSAKTKRMHRSRPDGLPATEIVARDDRPIDAEESRDEKRSVEERLRILRDDPEERARSVEKGNRESTEKTTVLDGLRRGFDLRLEGLDWLDGVPCWVVSLAPRPDFVPETKEQAYLKKVRGVAWIRARQPAILRIEADIVENLSVKWGPLATLSPGSHLHLEQREMLPGVVMTKSLELDLRLRILFMFRRYERRGEYYREFRRVNEPVAWTFVP